VDLVVELVDLIFTNKPSLTSKAMSSQVIRSGC
jgi:hypothetical protein